ncbi:MAG: bifunctional 5,10-methylenetetrahydrofolate dehydrogenase/5,10-methenyltetrahydrofolate cyclohydrolase [Candidatus Omnitrophica bacterium]|nr:bifunctional 5,10-methylenetetrahydrofolate dehydrogenase/5,10-methenyltetrahydrofolate cyclohydrolase [Candidatus Omnitrophota bacterium]MDD5671688.1 bifunctional 5,10-methylenetetrahydrofolate dehydrogenase/5,10-methenyltetrahydrofolate cyclohydrolase [Candidatus Omnitrophota bacterium]
MAVSIKEAKLLEGKVIAERIQGEIRQMIEQFLSDHRERPRLRAIQVGDDASADWYLRSQEKLAVKLGIDYEKIPANRIPNPKALLEEIDRANESPAHGVFMTMPLPPGFDPDEALLRLNPKKDVEGIHPTNLGLIVLRHGKLIPPTAYAAFALIESTGIELRGRKAVLIGQSAIVGRPLQLLLGEKRVMTVVCNTGTPVDEIRKAIAGSDIVIACAGTPRMIKGDWIREGQIVIDVGTSEVEGQMVGDVEFEEASKRASFITPVPGGVGPLTVTMLMKNLMHAYQWQKGI